MTIAKDILTAIVCILALIDGGIAFGLHWLACQGIAAGRAVAMWIARRV